MNSNKWTSLCNKDSNLTGSYNPILNPPYKHWRCSPGTMPFQSAERPSSLAIVPTVPSIPLYLGKEDTSPATACFWSWSLTLAVSKGMVQTYINYKNVWARTSIYGYKWVLIKTVWELTNEHDMRNTKSNQ